jgi:anti-sigma-K factor RskA
MDVHDLTAAYALDALDPDERERFELHLGSCARCRNELTALGGAAAALALAAPAAEPPARLRTRILEAAAAERENVRPLRRRLPLMGAATTAASVAACAAIGLGVWAATLSHELTTQKGENAAMQILLDPSSRKIALHGGSGMVAVDAHGRGVLLVHRLRAAPAGMTYEAWVIPRGGTPQQAGLFRGGSGMTMVRLGQTVARGSVVAATIERAGGVSRPTRSPLFAAQT